MKFALLGKTLKHSYSVGIHSLLGDYDYSLREVLPENLAEFVNSCDLDGYNVTIPYKKDIMPFLDEIDKKALEIGAVNTVVKKDGKLKGYNTDFDGMLYMLNRAKITLKGKKVVILGSGGTSNTASAVCKFLGAKEIVIVSRTGEVNYQNLAGQTGVNVIINTTPVGMNPDNYNSAVLDLSQFSELEGVADVIYNPSLTYLCYQARELNLSYTTGLPMLVAQAKYASELFTGKKIDDSVIEKIIEKLSKELQNVVLIGMPGCGKTTIGKEVAKLLGKEFIDTDKLIEEKAGKDIPTIFSQDGEDKFRELESLVVREVGKLTGKVVSTGGGVVKRWENYFPLKSNGKIVLINRDQNKLCQKGRPLSKDLDAVKKLYQERKDLYLKFADCTVDNNQSIDEAVKGVTESV